jgi:hypothetical protein
MANKKISWSTKRNAIRILFAGGNIISDDDAYEAASKELISRGIIINSVYFLSPNSIKDQSKWEDMSRWSGGKYARVADDSLYNSNSDTLLEDLGKLNRKLNATYLYYGNQGSEQWKKMVDMDDQVYKESSQGFRNLLKYRTSDRFLNHNSTWDLVELYAINPQAALNANRAFVSDSMKNMTPAEFKSYIVNSKWQRQLIVSQIQQMLALEKMKKEARGNANKKTIRSFDVITTGWLEDQIKSRGIGCEN